MKWRSDPYCYQEKPLSDGGSTTERAPTHTHTGAGRRRAAGGGAAAAVRIKALYGTLLKMVSLPVVCLMLLYTSPHPMAHGSQG